MSRDGMSAEAQQRSDVGRISQSWHETVLALEIIGVSMHFGGVQAVSDVTVEIAEGMITGVIGPNGAGKSTLINVVSGFLKPTAGRVRYQGVDVASWPAHRVARAGV